MKLIIKLLMICCSSGVFAGECGYIVKPTTEKPVMVMVGGVNDTSKSLAKWGEAYKAIGYETVGFDYPFKTESMARNAILLVQFIKELRVSGATQLVIVAHSMGGLITKRAVDIAQTEGLLSQFSATTVITLGTPWGGYWFANLSSGSWREIGTYSEYITSLAVPLQNVDFIVVDSEADDIAKPVSSSGRQNYLRILEIANKHIRLDNVNHIGFFDPCVMHE